MRDPINPNTYWLTGLILGAANTISLIKQEPFLSNLVSVGRYEGDEGVYEVLGVKTDEGIAPLVNTGIFKLYVAKLPVTDQWGLMKINASPKHVGVLEREARILQTLQYVAADLDKAKFEGKRPYNYGAQFPKPVEIVKPDSDHFVMFLEYHPSITNYKQLVPLSIIGKDQRVDLKTIQWILGKLLKLLGFVHSLNFTIGLLNATKVLVETKLHGVFVLDFSHANENATREDCLFEVSTAAKLAWYLAGGTNTQDPPHDTSIISKEGYDEYIAFLKRLMSDKTNDATEQHKLIYEMADRIWPKEDKVEKGITVQKRPFHDFVTYPR